MMEKKVGVIGATGNIGRTVVSELIGNNNVRMIITCRNISKLSKLYKHNDKVKFMQLNVNNCKELQEFADECDIVINCSSPSSLLYNKVAKVCLENNIDYIDVSGNGDLSNYLEGKRQLIEDKKLSYILSAGIYPGFTEIYPYYVMNLFDGKIDNMTAYFSSVGELSSNAAYDFVSSFEHEYAYGMSYYKEGNIKKIAQSKNKDSYVSNHILFSEVYPIISQEFIKMVNNNGSLKEAYFYNAYPDKTVFNEFMIIKIMSMHKNIEEKMKCAKSIATKYSLMARKYGNLTKLYIELKGEKENKKALVKSSFEFDGDSNYISAIVAYACVNAILKQKKFLGLTLPYSVIDIEDCLKKLKEKGAVINTSIEYI
ncbi:NAD-dependent epimerase/dehydratase family protein [Clostridium botulinum]|uniref:saccharopine dehydrogenase NADP-binding domain-containing protein n=1 Tax=Clostridium botulinum TaxID=1491 RepID=UPI00196807F3|nr:saccharopine dehydrogenase NADP-binding domain-containing protein [Clostridium botulinum]MBN1074211.1 NAD-dependent epimerase/dehydratase family protein [Clostridium botulinum]